VPHERLGEEEGQQRTTNATAFCRAPPLYIGVLFEGLPTVLRQAGNVTADRAGLSDPPIRHSRSADWIRTSTRLNVGPWPRRASTNTAANAIPRRRKTQTPECCGTTSMFATSGRTSPARLVL
jgi:hypothetical protein